jgi:hypothetical protein
MIVLTVLGCQNSKLSQVHWTHYYTIILFSKCSNAYGLDDLSEILHLEYSRKLFVMCLACQTDNRTYYIEEIYVAFHKTLFKKCPGTVNHKSQMQKVENGFNSLIFRRNCRRIVYPLQDSILSSTLYPTRKHSRCL